MACRREIVACTNPLSGPLTMKTSAVIIEPTPAELPAPLPARSAMSHALPVEPVNEDAPEDHAAVRRYGQAYGPAFWLAYCANASTMIAISMLVRYADFVTHLGGAEAQLGLIVGVGMIGSLCMRAAQGVAIDRYGSRKMWLWSLAFFNLSLLLHLPIKSSAGLAIFAVRILMQTSIAGIFGASITYISRRVPPERMAEIIGTLGTSGFVGTLVGPVIADAICGGPTVERVQLDRLFLVATGFGAVALLAAGFATRNHSVPRHRDQTSILAVLRQYNPGWIMLVSIAVGGGVSMPNTFLRTYVAELGLSKVGTYFIVYACCAFAARIASRRAFERHGNRRWVLIGLVLMTVSMLLYLIVDQAWKLVFPAVLAGAAHALLFPAVVATGSTRFPERYRGLGTTLMLAMFDMGGLLGAPAIGGTLLVARQLGWPAYPTMFLMVSAAIMLVAGIYAWHTRGIARKAAVEAG